MARSSPVPLTNPQRLAGDVHSASGLLLGLDFDGTLAPIDENPDVPTVDDSVADPLRALAAQESVRVAIVSGRALDDLVDRVGIDGVTYAGNHGLELYRDGERTVPESVERFRAPIRAVCSSLRSSVSDVPGSHVEDKGLTLAVHVRRTPAERVDDVRQVVLETVADAGAVTVDEGKQVFDIRPAVDHDKGTAMDLLVDDVPSDWVTLYLGDDTTDEDAFEAIQPDGIGIHVGTRPETSAEYRIPAQEQVSSFLTWLASTVASTDA